jgi:hypothetical protein
VTSVRLPRLRDAKLARALLRNDPRSPVGELEIGAVDWWLEWLADEAGSDEANRFYYIMARLFAQHGKPEVQLAFVSEFNNEGSKFRRLLAWYILPHFPNLTTDMFNQRRRLLSFG